MEETKQTDQRCGGCKSMEEEIYWRHINPICFSLAFCSDFRHMLRLPKRFADNVIPNILHEKLSVRGPSGASWEVDVMKSLEGHFLQGGWEEFVKAHSIEEKDTLLFIYDRKSSFDVKIFAGECEKVETYFVKKCGHLAPSLNNQKKRVLDEIIGNDVDGDDNDNDNVKDDGGSNVDRHQAGKLRPCTKTTKKIRSLRKRIQFAVNCVRKKGMSRSSMGIQGRGSQAEVELVKTPEQSGPSNNQVPDQNGSINKGSSVHQTPPAVPEITPPPDFEKAVSSRTRVTRPRSSTRSLPPKKKAAPAASAAEYVSNRRPVTDQEKDAALKKAASELTDNSFFAALPFTACYKGFFMTIPSSFASAHLGLKNQDVILCVGAKIWKTKFSFSRGGLGSGWKKFALDNNLEESDVCLFRLVSQASDETVMLHVSIFRVVEDVVIPPTLLMSPRVDQ